MYAIVDIAGQQFRVEKGQEIFVHRLAQEKGAEVSFDQVMLIDQEGKVNIGSPVIKGAQVKATVMDHMKGDKVFVFKKKRRKSYQKLNGHRQYLSLIRIEDILEKAVAKPRAKKAKAEVQPEEPAVTESNEPVAEN